MLSRVSSLLAGYLAQPARRDGTPTEPDPRQLAALLRPGDVLLTDGKTRAAALVRRVTRSDWAHVSMYVGPLDDMPDPRCIVEADIAGGVRAVPLSELAGQQVRVLRATFLGEDERRRLADWVVGRIGDGYDIALVCALAARLLCRTLLFRAQSGENARRFICSSLLAQAFLLVGYPIAGDQRYVTPRDFDGASGFEVVQQV